MIYFSFPPEKPLLQQCNCAADSLEAFFGVELNDIGIKIILIAAVFHHRLLSFNQTSHPLVIVIVVFHHCLLSFQSNLSSSASSGWLSRVRWLSPQLSLKVLVGTPLHKRLIQAKNVFFQPYNVIDPSESPREFLATQRYSMKSSLVMFRMCNFM